MPLDFETLPFKIIPGSKIPEVFVNLIILFKEFHPFFKTLPLDPFDAKINSSELKFCSSIVATNFAKLLSLITTPKLLSESKLPPVVPSPTGIW